VITRDGVAPRVTIPPPPRVSDLRDLTVDGPSSSAGLWAEATRGGVAVLDERTFTAWHEGERCWLVASEVDAGTRRTADVFVTADARVFRVTRTSSR
jgi:hypothetical protein